MSSKTYAADEYADIARRLREISSDDAASMASTQAEVKTQKEPDVSYDEGYQPYCGHSDVV